jgi:hypothetical protein
VAGWIEMKRIGEATMKKKLILAALLMSMAVTVFAEEELIWEEQTAVEDVMYAFEEETTSVEEQTASEDPEYVFEEPAVTIEEEIKDEDVVSEEIAFDQSTELIQEESVFEQVVSEEVAEAAAVDESSVAASVSIEGLIYTGEPQELILPQTGDWTYSLDGEQYTSELPTAVNAGEYTVYMKEGEKEVLVITVTIAKADVIFTPPVANTSSTTATSEAGTGVGAGEEPAYADEVVFEEVF